MTSKRKIAINTIATYSRSLLSMGLALFSVRWVLGALGPTDFGLFNVVGSIIVFITFLNGVMCSSASRHFAYAIGQGDKEEVKKWFNVSLSIHIVLPLALTIIGYFIGRHLIANFLTIPPKRLEACQIVFAMSLVAAFFNMMSIPFIAMFTAKQYLLDLAVFMGLNSVLTFSFAYILTKVDGDLLIFYGTYMMGINILIPFLQATRAYLIFDECKINSSYWFDKQKARELWRFASWAMIGNFGYIMRNQGVTILVNKYFGPVINSSYGIANQVSAQTASLSSALNGAFAPAITTAEGASDRERSLTLALAACKYGTFLVLLFAIPLMMEIDYVLTLWLKQYPQYTNELCVLILTAFIIDKITSGHLSAILAHGDIALKQLVLAISIALTIPLIWLFFELGFSPASLGYGFIIMRVLQGINRLYFAKKLLGLPVLRWFNQVFVRLLLVALLSITIAFAIKHIFPSCFFRLIVVCFLTFIGSCFTTWFIVMERNERCFILTKLKHFLFKKRI